MDVHPSQISAENAGEGLFAKKDFSKGNLLALFNGVRSQTMRVGNHEEGSEYKIRLNGQIDLDIPDEMTSLEKYSATSGHKVSLMMTHDDIRSALFTFSAITALIRMPSGLVWSIHASD